MTEERAHKEIATSLKDELSLLSNTIELKETTLNEAYSLVDCFNAEVQLCSYKGLSENLRSWSLSFALFASWRQNDPLTFKQMEQANLDIFQLLSVFYRTLSQETLIQQKLYDIFPKLTTSVRKYRDLDFLEHYSNQIFDLSWILLLYMKNRLKQQQYIDCSMETSSLYNLAIATFCILILDKGKNEGSNKRQKIVHGEISLCELDWTQVNDICQIASAVDEDVIKFIRIIRKLVPSGVFSMLPINSLSVINACREMLVVDYESLRLDDLGTISFDELQIFCSIRSACKGSSLQPEKELHVLASLASGSFTESSSAHYTRLEELTKLAKLYFGDSTKLDISAITSSLTATKWLRDITRMRPEVSFEQKEDDIESSTNLKRFCDLCGLNTYNNVIDTAFNIVFSFFKKNPWYGNEILEERKKEIIGLYLHVLEKVLLTEERRLHRQNFGSLLANEYLHRSLIACSIVASLACYGCQDRYLFISVLRGVDISPFEYTKSIGSFVTSIEDIPRSVQKFLVKIEEISVESICWQDSSVVDYLERSLGEVQFHVSCSDTSSFGPLDLYDSAVSESIPYSVLVFFRKLLRIAREKVRDFCLRMEVSDVFEELVFITVNYALTRHFNLLVNRHVDVIVMCALYAVSKITKEQLKFNDIAAFYRDIFQRKANHLFDIEENLSRVYLEGHHYGDIIEFYNRDFIKHFRNFLLEHLKAIFEERMKARSDKNEKNQGEPSTPVRSLHSKTGQSPSGSDSVFYTPSPSVRTSPSRKIGKVTISPMSPEGRRQMARRTPMTPKTKSLYAFGESPSGSTVRNSKSLSSETGVSGIDENLQGAKPLSFNCGAFGRYNSLVPILITSEGRPPLPPQERGSS
ncbi:Retinoblastoma-associated protein [Galdieria sulphuraria]|nr:Retinoblastoma-associated protein [Galdieria sulphuraria]